MFQETSAFGFGLNALDYQDYLRSAAGKADAEKIKLIILQQEYGTRQRAEEILKWLEETATIPYLDDKAITRDNIIGEIGTLSQDEKDELILQREKIQQNLAALADSTVKLQEITRAIAHTDNELQTEINAVDMAYDQRLRTQDISISSLATNNKTHQKIMTMAAYQHINNNIQTAMNEQAQKHIQVTKREVQAWKYEQEANYHLAVVIAAQDMLKIIPSTTPAYKQKEEDLKKAQIAYTTLQQKIKEIRLSANTQRAQIHRDHAKLVSEEARNDMIANVNNLGLSSTQITQKTQQQRLKNVMQQEILKKIGAIDLQANKDMQPEKEEEVARLSVGLTDRSSARGG